MDDIRQKPGDCPLGLVKQALYLAIVSGLGLSAPAYADWARVGAAVRCDKGEGVFELRSTLDSTGPEVPAPKSFTPLPVGSQQVHTCKLGGLSVKLTISVFAPDVGMDEGAGSVVIDSLSVAGVAVVSPGRSFNWPFGEDDVLTRIRIVGGGKSERHAQMCTSTGFEWEDPYANEICEKRAF